MQAIDFDVITKPAPAPYDSADPEKQRENLAYRLNQLFDQISGEMNIDVAEQIGDLSMAGKTIEIPGLLKIHHSGSTVTFTVNP